MGTLGPPTRGQNANRTALVGLLAVLSIVATYGALLVLDRLHPQLAWLLRPLAYVTLPLVVGIGGAWLVHRRLPCRPWVLASVATGAAIAGGMVFALIAPFFLHLKPAASALEDGWIRCPHDDATVWARTSCGSVGLPERTQCFVCSGVSGTVDRFVHTQGFSADCSEATVTYGVNVAPRAIDHCQGSVRREDCFTPRDPEG